MTENLLLWSFILLILFQIKHFLADYIVQFQYPSLMGKFNATGWIPPLALHCFHHFIGTFAIIFGTLWAMTGEFFVYIPIVAAIFDFIIHFTMDRIKASPFLLGKHHYPSPKYFYSLAVDQMVHHITHYVIIFALIGYIALTY